MKYWHDTEPRAFAKLRQVPSEILNAANIMLDLQLSRAQLKRVHEYIAGPETANQYPDAKKVRRHIRNACIRSEGEGKKTAVFRIESDSPGCPAQSIVFEVPLVLA